MAVLSHRFVQDPYADSEEYRRVCDVADALLTHLNEPDAQTLLAAANAPRQSSLLVQQSFAAFAAELGFRDESKGLFDEYANRAVRPDYYLPVADTGILLEVERGKTTINNMDFLDFWKCHLCEAANYLFLMVPQELRQNPTMAPRREYAAVLRRMGSFFMPRNYTNVRGLEGLWLLTQGVSAHRQRDLTSLSRNVQDQHLEHGGPVTGRGGMSEWLWDAMTDEHDDFLEGLVDGQVIPANPWWQELAYYQAKRSAQAETLVDSGSEDEPRFAQVEVPRPP